MSVTPLSNIPTETLEAQIRQRGLSWQDIAKAVIELHQRYLIDGTSATYQDTGRKLGYHDGSTVARYHKVWELWHLVEVREAATLNKALAAVQTHLAAKAPTATKLLLGRAKLGVSPEVELKRKLNKIFKQASQGDNTSN